MLEVVPVIRFRRHDHDNVKPLQSTVLLPPVVKVFHPPRGVASDTKVLVLVFVAVVVPPKSTS